MKNQVISEVSIIPVGTGDTGISHYIAACLEVLEGRGDLSYRLTPMGTVIEGPLDTVMEVTRQMHEIPFSKGASRVVTVIKIDDRRDKPSTMADKIESVLKQLPSVKT
ncbi:MAG TPA: MTH1187 family thiamine-binding protein [Dehalococcoidia bacterium]|nr:MTH1187 family thiamine-binding protein [Dehalococcoidia bacterium]